MEIFVDEIIKLGQSIGGEVLSGVLLLILYTMILLLLKFFSKEGLYLYNIVALIVANIQVLKVTPFFLTSEPVALGTLLFATIFLTTDILNEHFGVESAKIAVKLSFISQIIMTILMVITISYPSLGGITGIDKNKVVIDSVQAGLYSLFSPSVRILFASLIAYYVSQFVDIKLFSHFKKNIHLLWFRSNISTMCAGLVDNVLFGTFAWIILNPSPVSIHTLFFTYIMGTYVAIIIVSISSTPIIYLSYRFLPNNNKDLKCHSLSNIRAQ